MGRWNKCGVAAAHNARAHGHSKTPQQYAAICTRWGNWVAEKEGTQRVDPGRYPDLAQAWLDDLQALGRSPDTLHTYRAALAAGIGCKMADFSTPQRGVPTKGRDTSAQYVTDRSQPVYDFARATGIRKDEIAALRGGDLRRDAGGRLWLHVASGKGGKEQWQYILPQNEKIALAAFSQRTEGQPIFSRDEIRAATHAGLHGARRECAREMYQYFLTLPDKDMQFWRAELRRRFEANPTKRATRAFEKYQSRLGRTPEYRPRGQNSDRMRLHGIDPVFSREAVMMVSVFGLSHYREDVTVTNYLIK